MGYKKCFRKYVLWGEHQASGPGPASVCDGLGRAQVHPRWWTLMDADGLVVWTLRDAEVQGLSLLIWKTGRRTSCAPHRTGLRGKGNIWHDMSDLWTFKILLKHRLCCPGLYLLFWGEKWLNLKPKLFSWIFVFHNVNAKSQQREWSKLYHSNYRDFCDDFSGGRVHFKCTATLVDN